jgi:hypothetical protein
MPKKRTSKKATRKQGFTDPQEVAEYYEKLRKGTPASKLRDAASHFDVTTQTVRKALMFWWPGPKYKEEFPEARAGRQRYADVSDDVFLEALNETGSVRQAAAKLGMSQVTLAKQMKERNIKAVYTKVKEG